MNFKNQEEEDRYRRFMPLVCFGDPTRNWCLEPPEVVVSEYEKLSVMVPSSRKKDLDYYEKKLNEFPEIKI